MNRKRLSSLAIAVVAIVLVLGACIVTRAAVGYKVVAMSMDYGYTAIEFTLETEHGWDVPNGAKVLHVEPRKVGTKTPIVSYDDQISFNESSVGSESRLTLVRVPVYGKPLDVFEKWYTYQYLKKSTIEGSNPDEDNSDEFVILGEQETTYSITYRDMFWLQHEEIVSHDEWELTSIGDYSF